MSAKRILGLILTGIGFAACDVKEDFNEVENVKIPLKSYKSYPDLRDFPPKPLAPEFNQKEEAKKCS